MNQPCYNSIALARHQHEIDRQEAKEHWIAAAVDRILDNDEWRFTIPFSYSDAQIEKCARKMAEEEYQQHLSALAQARIDGQEGL